MSGKSQMIWLVEGRCFGVEGHKEGTKWPEGLKSWWVLIGSFWIMSSKGEWHNSTAKVPKNVQWLVSAKLSVLCSNDCSLSCSVFSHCWKSQLSSECTHHRTSHLNPATVLKSVWNQTQWTLFGELALGLCVLGTGTCESCFRSFRSGFPTVSFFTVY